MGQPFVIAVVDDDVAMREALAGLLRSCGYDVRAFDCAESFLAVSVLAEIDCIVLDVRMPGLSGIELQETLNSKSPRPPTIFITSYYDEFTVSAALAGGAHDFLTKPVDDEVLLASLRSAIPKHGDDVS